MDGMQLKLSMSTPFKAPAMRLSSAQPRGRVLPAAARPRRHKQAPGIVCVLNATQDNFEQEVLKVRGAAANTMTCWEACSLPAPSKTYIHLLLLVCLAAVRASCPCGLLGHLVSKAASYAGLSCVLLYEYLRGVYITSAVLQVWALQTCCPHDGLGREGGHCGRAAEEWHLHWL